MSGILTRHKGAFLRVKGKLPMYYRNLPWISARSALNQAKGEYKAKLTAIINDAIKVEKCSINDLSIRIVPSYKGPAIAVKKRQRIEL